MFIIEVNGPWLRWHTVKLPEVKNSEWLSGFEIHWVPTVTGKLKVWLEILGQWKIMEHHLLSNHPTKMDDGFKHSTEPATFSRINQPMVDIYIYICWYQGRNTITKLKSLMKYIYIYSQGNMMKLEGVRHFFQQNQWGLPWPASDSAVGAKGTWWSGGPGQLQSVEKPKGLRRNWNRNL